MTGAGGPARGGITWLEEWTGSIGRSAVSGVGQLGRLTLLLGDSAVKLVHSLVPGGRFRAQAAVTQLFYMGSAAVPIVALRKGRPIPLSPIPYGSDEWKRLYRGRASVEREFGRLKHDYALAPLRVRGLDRVRVHADLVMLGRLTLALYRAHEAVALAASRVHPGDTVLLARGSTFNEQLDIKYSGVAGSPITFGAYGEGADPVLTGGAKGIHGSKTHYITIENLTITETAGNAIYAGQASNWVIDNVTIIDVAGGHQPMATEDGRYAIVHNGEVFNFPALRRELEGLGHRFRTRSDTEAILRGFVQWGDDVWPRLEAMYAVAIWDRATRTLRLARDPLGIKPLHYTLQRGGLAFGSEIKALTPVPGLAFTPRPASIDAYFAFGHTLAPHSIYDEVRQLPPGSLLTIGPDGPPRVERFWRFAYRPGAAASEADWIERFRATFTATVQRHLIADTDGDERRVGDVEHPRQPFATRPHLLGAPQADRNHGRVGQRGKARRAPPSLEHGVEERGTARDGALRHHRHEDLVHYRIRCTRVG